MMHGAEWFDKDVSEVKFVGVCVVVYMYLSGKARILNGIGF